MDRSNVLDQITGIGSTLAGLVLVFLGATVAAYESYGAEAQGAVRGKYRRRAGVALAGFVAAILAVALSLLDNWIASSATVPTATVLLVASLLLLLFLAWLTFRDTR